MDRGERPITDIKGIGETRRRVLNKLGITTVGDALRHYPRAYQNRGAIMSLAEIKARVENGDVGPFATLLTISCEPVARMIRRGLTITKLSAFDESASCEITFFNQKFVKAQFHTGSLFRFWGRFQLSHGRLQMTSPLFEPCTDKGENLPPFYPVYPLSSGLTQKLMHKIISDALTLALPEISDPLPQEILEKYSLPTLSYALRNIHFPKSEEAIAAAGRRLVFDELFIASAALASSGKSRKKASLSVIADTDILPYLESLPFTMTGAQRRSLEEIISDMSSDFAMNRMLCGDVGSGKTAVAAGAAYLALKNGFDCLFMVPTEILATQHYKDMSRIFSDLGIEVALLTGHTGNTERANIRRSLASDEPILLIGTHALLSDDISPSSLGLVIIDEQHRFGAKQRAALASKADGINMLSMSATPIPRTLQLIIYGSLDISRIDELPSGRKPVDTFTVNESYRARLRGFISRQVEEGHQVYIVCPAIEEAENDREPESLDEAFDYSIFPSDDASPPLKAVSEYSEDLRRALPHLKIAVVHGKMKSSDRDEIMSSFCNGDIDVIVSTTVIEVGVNVPNATLMIVENAERFGLSQLHQLRGRVGRGSAKSYFILVSDSDSERAARRLSVIKHCSDGYEISEADLKLRGPGDIFEENGVLRQHGTSSLKLASVCTDTEFIANATESGAKIVEADPDLALPEHSELRKACERFISELSDSVN